MIAQAKSRAVFKIEDISRDSIGRRFVVISGRMGEAEPEFTQKLYIGEQMESNMEINIDTDKEAKWDLLHVEKT